MNTYTYIVAEDVSVISGSMKIVAIIISSSLGLSDEVTSDLESFFDELHGEYDLDYVHDMIDEFFSEYYPYSVYSKSASCV